jgi:multiple sugar transport system permease protein
MSTKRNLWPFFFLLITILLVIVSLFPLYWVGRMAFTPNKAIGAFPGSFLPPRFELSNFQRVLGSITGQDAVLLGGSGQKINFVRFLTNSVIVSSLVTVSQVFFSALGAYAFARLRFPGRQMLFRFYLAALMVPTIVMLIPNFILIKELGWLNSYLGVAAPALLMTPFAVFFLRQFFLGVNRELEEAALIDGAGRLRTFFQIIVPISQPAVATLAIITFINQWNDYLWPLIVGRDEGSRLLTVALGIFRSQTPNGAPDWGGLMAGTTLALLPTLALFLAFGKRVVNSVGFSGFR